MKNKLTTINVLWALMVGLKWANMGDVAGVPWWKIFALLFVDNVVDFLFFLFEYYGVMARAKIKFIMLEKRLRVWLVVKKNVNRLKSQK